MDDDAQNLEPAPEHNPFEKYKGVLRHFPGREEINAWIRDLRGYEGEEI